MKPVVFIAKDILYIIIPDGTHDESSWEESQKDMKKKFQEAREIEASDRKNWTDDGILRDDNLGLKLLEKHSHVWRCSVIEAKRHAYWMFSEEK